MSGKITAGGFRIEGGSPSQFLKADGSVDNNVYTGDQDLSSLAPKVSPAFTGTPAAPTAAAGTNTTQIATTAFVLANLPSGGGDMVLASTQTVGGLKTFLNGMFGLRNVANTFTSFFTNAVTASRTWTFQDKSYTVADNADIAVVALNEGFGIGLVVAGRTAANYGNIGLGAVDLSNSSSTSSTKGATGTFSFASGQDNTASGNYSTAVGQINVASGTRSTASGQSNTASGDSSTAIGSGNTASGIKSTAIGDTNTASGTASTAMGSNNASNGNSSSAFGAYNTAGGNFSLVAGFANNQSSFAESIFGLWNLQSTPSSTTAWVGTDRLFTVGNGVDSSNKSNAFVMLKNGTATLPSLTNTLIQAETTGKVIITKEYINRTFTVATLPTPASGVAYATVTDATAPTYLGALTGGGSVVCPVFYNGTAWVSR